MAVTIVSEQSKLHIDGDIRGTLYVPAELPKTASDGEVLVYSYYIALSDGSLIQASNHDEAEFDLIVEGAGHVSIGRDGKSLSIDWRIEWINLSSNHGATAFAHKMPASLPLFDKAGGRSLD
jgi:hypothetical protein